MTSIAYCSKLPEGFSWNSMNLLRRVHEISHCISHEIPYGNLT
jgi:hypothetical protein